jgi:hypothetical protein
VCITTHSTFFFPHINKEVRGVCLQRINSLVRKTHICPKHNVPKSHTFAQNTMCPNQAGLQAKLFFVPSVREVRRIHPRTNIRWPAAPPFFSHARTHWVARQAHTRTNTCGPPRHTFSRTNIASLGGAAGHDASFFIYFFPCTTSLAHTPHTLLHAFFSSPLA